MMNPFVVKSRRFLNSILFFVALIVPCIDVFAQDVSTLPQVYFEDACWQPERIEGDSIVLKLTHGNPIPEETGIVSPIQIKRRYFGIKDSLEFLQYFKQHNIIDKCFIDFAIDFETLNALAAGKPLCFNETYISRLDCKNLSQKRRLVTTSKFFAWSCHFDKLFMGFITFKDTCFFDQLTSRRTNILDCQFKSLFRIADVNTYHLLLPNEFELQYNIDNCEVEGECEIIRNNRATHFTIYRTQFYGSTGIDNSGFEDDSILSQRDSDFYCFRLGFYDCSFHELRISAKLQGIAFGKVSIDGMLDLSQNLFYDSYKTKCLDAGLKSLYFSEGAILKIGIGSDITKYQFGLDALQKCKLSFDTSSFFIRRNDAMYFSILRNFDRIKQYTGEYKTNDARLRDDVIAWLDYQCEAYRCDFYRAHKNQYWGKLVWSDMLEFLVHNGYKGEWTFASRALTLILLFAVVFFIFFRQAVHKYVIKEEFIDLSKSHTKQLALFPPVKGRPQIFLDLAICFWFSFVVFINPRLPNKYFKFGRNLFAIVLAEWAMGIFMLAIFAIYIASKYPFVKSLFGI